MVCFFMNDHLKKNANLQTWKPCLRGIRRKFLAKAVNDFIFRSMAPPMCTSPIIINISSTFKKLQYGMVTLLLNNDMKRPNKA